jgi:hypothetical protein
MARHFPRLDRSAPRSAAILQIVLTAVLVAALTSLVWWSIGRQPAPAPPPAQPAKVDRPEQPANLDRAGLIDLSAAAASAYAAGQPPPDQSGQIGRPFALRVVFACAAPELTLVKDPAQKSLKLTARLQDWTADPALQRLPGAPFDRVEGLWLPRPWIAAETCQTVPAPVTTAARAIDQLLVPPADQASTEVDPPEGPARTLGLASFFPAGSDRARQRGGKPYETVQKLDPSLEALTAADVSMLIEGRVGQAAEGRPVVCHAAALDRRPVCLVAVDIERVAFLRTGSDKPIAEWRP